MTGSLFSSDDLYENNLMITKGKNKETKKGFSRGSSSIMIRNSKNVYRRSFSETVLLELMDKEPLENGKSYHFMTGGDIDGLSYLKIILNKQRLNHVLLSTWCMSSEDIYQIQDWLENGKLNKVDMYVGEIFSGTYKKEMALLQQVFNKHQCGRICVFRNHSKIIAGMGENFSFFVESSANLNTNPRNENGCITIGKDIFNFYYQYYNNIITIDKQ